MLEECTLEVCTLVDMHGGGVHVGGVQVNAGSLQFSHTLVLLHTYTNTLTFLSLKSTETASFEIRLAGKQKCTTYLFSLKIQFLTTQSTI